MHSPRKGNRKEPGKTPPPLARLGEMMEAPPATTAGKGEESWQACG